MRWHPAGVRRVLSPCFMPALSPQRSRRFARLRIASRKCGTPWGCTPLDTKHWTPSTAQELREAAQADDRVVAIGELGLDLFRDSNLEEQLNVLRPQLELAVDLAKPVIIHCRDAAQPMLKELRALKAAGRCPAGVMHCWGGTPEEMDAFLELGFYISFSGTVTFPKAIDTHACARQVPQDRFLVETDCPFLAPVPRRGKRNEPSFVSAVARRVAELRDQPLEAVAESSTANARRLFALP